MDIAKRQTASDDYSDYHGELILHEIENHARAQHIPVMQKGGAELLERLVKETAPKTILEIGTAIGYSACIMLRAAPQAFLYTVDIDEEVQARAKENLEKFSIAKSVRFINGDAMDIVPMMTGKFDFILLDGPKSAYAKLLPYLIDLLPQGGILFADNVLYRNTVLGGAEFKRKHKTMILALRSFLEQIKSDERLTVSIYEKGDGIAVCKKI